MSLYIPGWRIDRKAVDASGGGCLDTPVRPVDLQVIGEELAIRWDDGGETFIALEALRRACPCAGCKGEVDVLGNLHKGPDRPFVPASFQLNRLSSVGTYGLQPMWADGHGTGIFTFEALRRLGSA